jgi:hypothetical protein
MRRSVVGLRLGQPQSVSISQPVSQLAVDKTPTQRPAQTALWWEPPPTLSVSMSHPLVGARERGRPWPARNRETLARASWRKQISTLETDQRLQAGTESGLRASSAGVDVTMIAKSRNPTKWTTEHQTHSAWMMNSSSMKR